MPSWSLRLTPGAPCVRRTDYHLVADFGRDAKLAPAEEEGLVVRLQKSGEPPGLAMRCVGGPVSVEDCVDRKVGDSKPEQQGTDN